MEFSQTFDNVNSFDLFLMQKATNTGSQKS